MQIWWVSYSIVHRNNLFLGSVQIYCYYVQKNCLFWASCRNNTVQWQGVPGFPCRAIFGGVQKYWFFGEIFTSGSDPHNILNSLSVSPALAKRRAVDVLMLTSALEIKFDQYQSNSLVLPSVNCHLWFLSTEGRFQILAFSTMSGGSGASSHLYWVACNRSLNFIQTKQYIVHKCFKLYCGWGLLCRYSL